MANDSGVVQQVAIKCLKAKMCQKFSAEFEKEFKIMVNLDHPNVVKILGQCPLSERSK